MILTQILSWLTLATHVVLVFIILSLLFSRTRHKLRLFFSKYGLLLSFAVSLAAISFSLYYSEIAGYEPCRLCWLQRVFIYPQAIIFGMALLRKEKQIFFYALPLTFIGLLVSIYHVIIQLFPAYETCSATGVACSVAHFISFGYIIIPVMSLTAFVLLLVIGLLSKN